jgi:sterol desaturase/sphingolipid hydroxylase (fatty acid hydroxylase superfamily)
MIYKSIAVAALFLFFAFFERYRPFIKNTSSSLFINLVLGMISYLFAYGALYEVQKDTGLLPHEISQPQLLLTLCTILLLDFVSYLWHRASHTFPLLWNLHRVHHSEHFLEASSAFRFHFLETTLSLIPRWLCVVVLQLPFVSLVIFEVCFQISNMFQHSNLRLPQGLEKYVNLIFVTPTMHRKHHSLNPQEQNSNYSTIFSFWDRFLRSYKDNSQEDVKEFGLKDIPQRLTIAKLVLLPFKF